MSACEIKLPGGPKFELDLPDAAILQNFAGNGAFYTGTAGTGVPLSVGPNKVQGPVQAAEVLDAGVSVDASTKASTCPMGELSVDGKCQSRSSSAAQCAAGGTLCSNGRCCAAGMTCGANGACEHGPEAANAGTPAVCLAGEQPATRDGSNCPAQTEARCCPAGAVLYCTLPNDPDSALCAVQAKTGTCGAGYSQRFDTSSGMPGCCPTAPGLAVITSGYCFYTQPQEPSCASGTKNEAAGTCCSGQTTHAGGCCASGHQVCGDGCCAAGESCDGMGHCSAAQPSTAPACPSELPRDCSSMGGRCCPADSECKPDGSCGCPAATPVDCGGFCAASADQCVMCPAEHPDACGSQCCLAGGCASGGVAGAGTCGCPSGTTTCGNNCCPSGSQCSNGQCLSCPPSAPVMCGNNCCAAGQMCLGNQCVSQ